MGTFIKINVLHQNVESLLGDTQVLDVNALYSVARYGDELVLLRVTSNIFDPNSDEFKKICDKIRPMYRGFMFNHGDTPTEFTLYADVTSGIIHYGIHWNDEVNVCFEAYRHEVIVGKLIDIDDIDSVIHDIKIVHDRELFNAITQISKEVSDHGERLSSFRDMIINLKGTDHGAEQVSAGECSPTC